MPVAYRLKVASAASLAERMVTNCRNSLPLNPPAENTPLRKARSCAALSLALPSASSALTPRRRARSAELSRP